MVAAAARRRDLAAWALVLAGLCVWTLALAAGAVAIGALALWFRFRLGGINGDAHGAGIELTETALLLALYGVGAR
jgi:adenosylcobinamide-GDP ribazoletransferase